MIFVLFENGKYPFVFAGTKRGRQIRNKLYFCKTARPPPDFFEPVKIRKTGLVFLPVSAKLFKTAELCGCLAGYCPIAGICFFCGIFALLFVLYICIKRKYAAGRFLRMREFVRTGFDGRKYFVMASKGF